MKSVLRQRIKILFISVNSVMKMVTKNYGVYLCIQLNNLIGCLWKFKKLSDRFLE